MRLAAIGDNCVDFYEKQGWAYPGGNAVNVAVYGRQLGMDAAYLGWIGTDNFGDMMQEKLKEQDVETVRMQRKQGKTAITYIELLNGDRKFGEDFLNVLEGFELSDENLQYYAYAEDLDFSYGVCLYAEKCEKRCIFSNRLIVNHNVSAEYRTLSRKATFMNYLHRYYICRKYNLSEFKFWWSNFGDLLFRLLKKESLLDYFNAMSFLIVNRNNIRSGNFMYKKFM